MKKGKGLKKALDRHQVKQSEKVRREAYEKRQEELKKQQAQGKPKKTKLANGQIVKKAPRKKVAQPFRDGEAVLFVGEGNFSFARAFAQRFPQSAKVSIATSYDSQEEAEKKYTDLPEILASLEEAGMAVMFSVDAQKLEKTKSLKKRIESDALRFDKVVFNFPHVGLGEKDEQRNIKMNQILLLRFLKSVKPFLKTAGASTATGEAESTSTARRRRGSAVSKAAEQEDEDSLPSDPESDEEEEGRSSTVPASACGAVLVTLFTCKPYNEWALPALAKSGPTIGASLLPFPESREAPTSQPRYKVNRSFEFSKEDWPGYDHRRTVGHKDGKASLLDREHAGARTWELSLA